MLLHQSRYQYVDHNCYLSHPHTLILNNSISRQSKGNFNIILYIYTVLYRYQQLGECCVTAADTNMFLGPDTIIVPSI